MLVTIVTIFCSCLLLSTLCDPIEYPGDKHLKNVQQLTWGGENINPVFHSDDVTVAYQGAGLDQYGTRCDAIYQFRLDDPTTQQTARRISSGIGLATRPHYLNATNQLIFASTSQAARYRFDLSNCPKKLCSTDEREHDKELDEICKSGYTWDLFPEYDIYQVNRFGNAIDQLTTTQGYDADVGLSPDGQKMVFTSVRTGDPEIWIMDSNLTQTQLTNEIGYDGHATFSRDGSKIVFEASRPKTDAELERYTKMLSYNLVSPKELELFVMNADGSNVTQLTHLGGANISPYFLKDGKRIIFASNHAMDRKCCDFALYLIDLDGKNLEKVTGQNGSADGFPTFDGNQRRMIWASRRNGTHQGETNIFIADWID